MVNAVLANSLQRLLWNLQQMDDKACHTNIVIFWLTICRSLNFQFGQELCIHEACTSTFKFEAASKKQSDLGLYY